MLNYIKNAQKLSKNEQKKIIGGTQGCSKDKIWCDYYKSCIKIELCSIKIIEENVL